jgi:biofilm PGA synthesis N-glycosyltransferase PgaC
MNLIYTILFILIGIIAYAYIGYGILLSIVVKIRRVFVKRETLVNNYEPSVSFIVAAYNEENYIDQKIKNCLSLNYPKDKIEFVFITDGSTDNTLNIVKKYPGLKWYHKDERRGKINAINRVIPMLNSEILIFSDANTDINEEGVLNIVRNFQQQDVGVVAGEKRIYKNNSSSSAEGEGIYWKYESYLKKLDSELYSTMGAAGELFAVRATDMMHVEEDILIEDFYLSMKILEKGKRIKYEPEAFAIETGSLNIQEELKRKIRISAGGLQSIVKLYPLLNPFVYGIASIQYISHRVLRWAICPFLLPFIFVLNLMLAINAYNTLSIVLMILQVLFYSLVYLGHRISDKSIKYKIVLISYYFFIMNYSVYLGLIRLLKGKQTVIWEKAIRA